MNIIVLQNFTNCHLCYPSLNSLYFKTFLNYKLFISCGFNHTSKLPVIVTAYVPVHVLFIDFMVGGCLL